MKFIIRKRTFIFCYYFFVNIIITVGLVFVTSVTLALNCSCCIQTSGGSTMGLMELTPPPPPPVQSQAPPVSNPTHDSLEFSPYGAPQNTGAEPLQFDKSKTATDLNWSFSRFKIWISKKFKHMAGYLNHI